MDYSEEYIKKNPTLHIEDAPIKFNEIKSELSKLNRVQSILDVGCGAGVLTKMIADFTKPDKVLGVDISQVMVDTANKLNTDKNIDYKAVDIYKFNASNKYDLVTCADIIEHVEDDVEFLKILSKFSNKIIIRVPMEDSIFNLLFKKLGISDELKKTELQYGHIHHYSVVSFLDLIKKANLEVSSYTLFKINKPRTWWVNEITRQISNVICMFSINFGVKLGGGFLVITLKSK